MSTSLGFWVAPPPKTTGTWWSPKGAAAVCFTVHHIFQTVKKKVAYEGTLPLNPCLSSATPGTTKGYLSIQLSMYPTKATHAHPITHVLRPAPLVTPGPGRHQSIMTLLRREVKNWIGESSWEILCCLLGDREQRRGLVKRSILKHSGQHLFGSLSIFQS